MENNQNTKQVSTKQLVMFVFILGMSIKMFMLPVLMLKTGGRDSWIAMGVCLMSELICLAMLLIASRLAPELTFFDLMESVLKKIGTKIISSVIALYFTLKLLLALSEIKIFFTVTVYENLPWAVYVIPLLALLTVISVKKLRALSRTAEILAPFIVLTVVIMCALLVINIDFANLLPVLEFGANPVVNSYLHFPMWYGDFTVVILFLGNIRRTKATGIATFVSAVIASAVVMFFSVMLFAAYANVGDILQYGQNISSLTQLTLSGFNLGRFDIIIFTVWMISVFIKAAVKFSAVVKIIEYTVGRKCPFWGSALYALLLYVCIVFIFSNETVFHGLAIDYLAIPALIMQFLVPATVLIAAVKHAVCQKKLGMNKSMLNKIAEGNAKCAVKNARP